MRSASDEEEGAAGSAGSSLSFSMRMTVYGIQKAFPSVRNVSCSDVDEWRRRAHSKKLLCLDVRPEEEYSVSHLPDAVRVEPSTEPAIQALGITPDTTVVCYCSVGYRSSDMAQRLYRAARNADVPLELYNMSGGIFQWAMEDRDIVNSGGAKAAAVHPYSALWGKLLPVKLRAAL